MSLNSQIADLILERGRAQAQGQAASGQAWGSALSNIGLIVSQIPQEIRRDKLVKQQQQEHDQRFAANALELGQRQHQIAGQQAMNAALANSASPDRQNPDFTGPQLPAFIKDGPMGTKLYDTTALAEHLNQGGYGDLTSTLLEGAEKQNQRVSQTIQARQNTRAATAATVIGLMDKGVPFDQAYQTGAYLLLANGLEKPEDVQNFGQQIAGLGDAKAQRAALLDLVKTSSEKPEVLKEGDVQMLHGVEIGGGAPKPMTKDRALTDLVSSRSTPEQKAAAQAWLEEEKKTKAPQTRTNEEQALDAYAKSLGTGKTRAEDLTYEERQNFDKNKAEITASASFKNHMRERDYDNAHPTPVKDADQNKLEQEARMLLTRAVSARSGGIGAEDAKVQQANHLISLMDQNYDPKTDSYNIPRVQQTELAMGLAKLVSPGGVVAQKTVDDINQATAKGDLAKALTYVTGKPFNGTTQDLVKMYRDSILRQGQTAMENREGEMRYLRGLMPTQLEESRRTALEANTLNPLRQSRVATDEKGNRKLFVSLDGGKTWK